MQASIPEALHVQDSDATSTDFPQPSTCCIKAGLLLFSYDVRVRNGISFAKKLMSKFLKSGKKKCILWTDTLEKVETVPLEIPSRRSQLATSDRRPDS